jgi:hypothetical protein
MKVTIGENLKLCTLNKDEKSGAIAMMVQMGSEVSLQL